MMPFIRYYLRRIPRALRRLRGWIYYRLHPFRGQIIFVGDGMTVHGAIDAVKRGDVVILPPG